MKEYDVVIIGSGAGAGIIDHALQYGSSVAVVDKGPTGGTCLNLGCIPSKMLIFPADRIAEIQESKKLGVDAEVKSVDFQKIMNRMREYIAESRDSMHKNLSTATEFDFYETECHFVDDYILDVDGKKIKGKKVFVASGARPLIPPIEGIDDVDYLTNESVLDLQEVPESVVIIGGGYIAVEYGHFLSAMGTDVTILQRGQYLVPNEEPEISETLEKELRKRMDVFTNTEATRVEKGKVYARDTKTDEIKEFDTKRIFVAAGRKPNSDLLKIENTSIKTDKRGYIKVDKYLETNVKNIYAVGDANGKAMFRHAANREALLAFHNSMHEKREMDFSVVPHAVFTHPQIAGVGLTEKQAREKYEDVLVGKAYYRDVVKGAAMVNKTGFAKAVLSKGKILGFHIIGPFAPILIQEVVNAITLGGEIDLIGSGMHIHPAMPEVIVSALSNALNQ